MFSFVLATVCKCEECMVHKYVSQPLTLLLLGDWLLPILMDYDTLLGNIVQSITYLYLLLKQETINNENLTDHYSKTEHSKLHSIIITSNVKPRNVSRMFQNMPTLLSVIFNNARFSKQVVSGA